MLTDGSNPNISKIIIDYTASVLRDYRNTAFKTAEVGVEAVPLMMFNPELKSVNLFVPGLMALILMLVSALLMRTIWFLVQKEFLQIFHNRGMLPIIIIMPFIQLVILSNAATFDVKQVPRHLQDRDRSILSEKLVERFTAADYFRLTESSFSDRESIGELLGRKADSLNYFLLYMANKYTVKYPSVPKVPKATGSGGASLLLPFFEAAL